MSSSLSPRRWLLGASWGSAAGFAGVVLMGLKFETAVGEAYEVWHDDAVTPLESDEIGLSTSAPR